MNYVTFSSVNFTKKTSPASQRITPGKQSSSALKGSGIQDTVTFTGNKKENVAGKKEPGKSILPAVLSLSIPGSGQMLNGQTAKGCAILGVTVAGAIALGMVAIPLAGAFTVGMVAYSAIDAYKNQNIIK